MNAKLLIWIQQNYGWVVVIGFGVLSIWGWINWQALGKNGGIAKERRHRWLEEDHFGRLYRDGLAWVLDGMAERVIGDAEDFRRVPARDFAKPANFVQRVFGFNPWTAKSYDFCLRLAVIYPIFFLLVFWTFGAVGKLGGFVALPALTAWERMLTIGGLLSICFSSFKSVKTKGVRRMIYTLVILALVFVIFIVGNTTFDSAIVIGVIIVTGVTVAVGGSVAIAIAFSSIFYVTFAIAFSNPNLVIFTISILVATTFGGTIAFTMAVDHLYAYLNQYDFKILFLALHWLFFFVGTLVTISYFDLTINGNGHTDILLISMFIVLLPLVNAPLDWLSLGVTRGLLEAIQTETHGGIRAVIWAIIDLLLAVFFLCAITLSVAATITLVNRMMGIPVIDLSQFYSSLCDEPLSSNHYWIYIMLLSTLIPTALHFALASAAVVLWFPKRLHGWVRGKSKIGVASALTLGNSEIDDKTDEMDFDRKVVIWSYCTFMPTIGFIAAPVALFSLLFWVLSTHGNYLGLTILNFVQSVSAVIDPGIVDIHDCMSQPAV